MGINLLAVISLSTQLQWSLQVMCTAVIANYTQLLLQVKQGNNNKESEQKHIKYFVKITEEWLEKDIPNEC